MMQQRRGNIRRDATVRNQVASRSIVSVFKLKSSALKIVNVRTARILKDAKRSWLVGEKLMKIQRFVSSR